MPSAFWRPALGFAAEMVQSDGCERKQLWTGSQLLREATLESPQLASFSIMSDTESSPKKALEGKNTLILNFKNRFNLPFLLTFLDGIIYT